MTSRQRTPGRRNSRLGRWFEDFLKPLHARYARERRARIHKTYPSCRVLERGKGAMFRGVWDGEALPDYIGLSGGWTWFTEAKECKGKRWAFSGLRGQQAEQLDGALEQGIGAFLLIRETDRNRAHLVPWERIRELWWSWEMAGQAGRRAANGAASIAFKTLEDDFISIHIGDTLPGGFDYLAALLDWRDDSADLRLGLAAQLQAEPPRVARRRNQRGSG